jgi:ketosteroid isomerase-like protein
VADVNRNYEAIKAHYAASDRRDVEAMMAPITEETRWTEMAGFPYAGTYVGSGAIVAGVFKRISEEWDDYTFSLERLIDGGKAIVGIGTYSGRYKKTGKAMTARVVHVWDMEDGRVVNFEQFTDTRMVAEATK